MRFVILGLFLVFISCKSTKNTVSTEQIAVLKDVVALKNFEVLSDFAQPLALNAGVTGLQNLMPPGSTINNISLIGNPNFFRVMNDSISMDLPYYGQQRMSRGYNSNIGIKFEGKIDSYTETFNEKKKTFVLKYSLKGEEERYDVILTLFPNNTSMMSINSSHRTSINYNGKWKSLNKEQ